MKFKVIPSDYFVTILDRLTRFEPAYIRYKRVYFDIISKFCSGIKFDSLSLTEQIELANSVVNNSVENNINDFISPVMFKLEGLYFRENEISYQYLSNSINLTSILNQLPNDSNLPLNIIWLKELSEESDIYQLRENKALLYPVEKILLCEGETERLLLSTLLELFGINLRSKGIMLIAAGGKNQVARKFYSQIEYTKLPYVILLDKDAVQIKDLLLKKTRPCDKIYLIGSGEFEDLIPANILEDAVNYIHNNEIHCLSDDFNSSDSMVHNLETIYKKYGFGEFKKAHFAQGLKDYIQKFCSKADFMNSEFYEIAKFFDD